MKKEEFRSWLKEVDGRNAPQTSDHISRIKRIETVFSSLDGKDCDVEMEYERDQCAELMGRLSLKSRRQISEPVNLPETPMGMSRLRSSLRKYIEYHKWADHRNK